MCLNPKIKGFPYLFFIVEILALVSPSVWPFINSLAMHIVVKPASYINSTIGPYIGSLI
jgi:hypothetical protein